jgi:NDP-sugar pyrophosphorylase family protein
MGSDLVGVIPAAGKGSRMGTIAKPKALIEIEGRTLLDLAIESLKSIGVSKIVVVVGYLADSIHDFLALHDFGLEIKTVHQQVPLGLAHAIFTAQVEINSDFVVLCPDNIYSDDSDLPRAQELFESTHATFVLLSTVTPSLQRDRKTYFTGARLNPAPNLYDYREQSDSNSGFGINSTGCVFFKHDALAFLPSFSEVQQEHIFRDYLETIANQRQCLLYLLRGMRYDFSGLRDVDEYSGLKQRLRQASGQGVSAILMNDAGEVLLQQRDDNPAIRYPGYWSLFGGTIEHGESAAEAVTREVYEEINYRMRNFGLFREFVQNNKREFAFVGDLASNIDQLTLHEGQGMRVFNPSELQNLLIRPDDKQTLEEYFGI